VIDDVDVMADSDCSTTCQPTFLPQNNRSGIRGLRRDPAALRDRQRPASTTGRASSSDAPPPVIPEPATGLLLAAGIGAMAVRARARLRQPITS
jgi:hypothetical protein